MNKQSYNLAALLVSASLAGYSVASLAEDTLLVVTASRFEQPLADTLADVEVIDRETIERLQPQSILDLLLSVAGVDISKSGGHGQASSFFLRGSNANHTLILIDGVRVGSATLGVKSVAQISPAQIERIEIVKGPRSALWGSEAIGGVVQIFTRRLNAKEFQVSVKMGSRNSEGLSASVGIGNQAFTNTFNLNHERTAGFDALQAGETDRDGFDRQNLSLIGDVKMSDSHQLDWLALVEQGNSEYDPDPVWGGPNQADHDNYLWNIRHSFNAADWTHQVALNASRDQSVNFGNGLARSQADWFETRKKQFNYLASGQISPGFKLASGFDWLEDDIGYSSGDYAKSKRITRSLFVNANYQQDAWLADLALRHDNIESIDSETTANMALGYRVNSAHLLSLNFAQGFKAPTFNDLYYPGGANPELVSETSDNLELLYKATLGKDLLVLSLYQASIDNLIEWREVSPWMWTPQNVAKAEVEGVDFHFDHRGDQIDQKFMASYSDPVNADTGEPLRQRAKQHLAYSLSINQDNWDFGIQLQHQGKVYSSNSLSGDLERLDSYAQVNANLGYRLKHWQFNLKINDLTDRAPQTVAGYRGVGQEIYLSVGFQNF